MRPVDGDEIIARCENVIKNGDADVFGLHILPAEIIIGFIKTMPAASYWIPCTDRLPEDGQYVICQQDNGDIGEAKRLGENEWLIMYDRNIVPDFNVVAWQPLPERWKG